MKKPEFKTKFKNVRDEIIALECEQESESGGLEFQEAVRWRLAQLEASKNGYWKEDDLDEEEEEFVVRKKSKRYINYWDE
jgi:hypothetical protein